MRRRFESSRGRQGIRGVTRRGAGIILLLVVSVSGCYGVKHLKYADETFPPRPLSHPIEIFRGKPDRAHIVIAQIILSPRWAAFSEQTAFDKMKERARELGADALTEVDIYTAHVGTVGSGQVSGRAYAVRWR